MDIEEADRLIRKIRCSEYILVIVGAGLSRPSGVPTFRDDPWFWERPIEDSATEAAFERDPIHVWTLYERLRIIALNATPNPGHAALARLAGAKPQLVTVSQNIDELCQRADHIPERLVSLHGSLFQIRCAGKNCTYETWNYTAQSVVPGLQIDPTRLDCSIASPSLDATRVPSCPRCESKLRPGVCWFDEKLPLKELDRIDRWIQDAPRVDLVLIIGTERTPFVQEALAKGAEVAWLNVFDGALTDAGEDWYVSGCASETLPRLVDEALR